MTTTTRNKVVIASIRGMTQVHQATPLLTHGVYRGAYLGEIRRTSLVVLDPIDVRAPKGFGG